jgi:hypothetical protein
MGGMSATHNQLLDSYARQYKVFDPIHGKETLFGIGL